MAMVGMLLLLLSIYVVSFILPLDWIARRDAQASDERAVATTSFRRELRRRGSYSMSYVSDIKAHVFARS